MVRDYFVGYFLCESCTFSRGGVDRTAMPLIVVSSPSLFITCWKPPMAISSPISVSNAAAIVTSFAPLAIAFSLTSPLPSQASPISLNLPTPYSQSQSLSRGLEGGRIRPCPSVNPGCISTNPKSSSFAFPLAISKDSLETAVQKLRDAIIRTQRNVMFVADEDTPSGRYLQVEVDGDGFGRDVMEFLVKGDIVAYRSMAAKVTYIYPFTTALGDSKGQSERLKKIEAELGWYSPSIESMDD